MKKFEKEELKLDKALKKEWIITNGIRRVCIFNNSAVAILENIMGF